MTMRPLIISCGILRRDIEFLARKNSWDMEMIFLPSALHFDFESLEKGLNGELVRHPGRHATVVYGSCHPLIDRYVNDAGGCRVACQNCVEMLLGHELFCRELEAGAYFLLEEWAHNWDYILEKTFGNTSIARDVFQGDRKYFLALKTPCSGNFNKEAEAAARSVGLPLRSLDISLEHLENLVRKTAEQTLSAGTHV